MENLSRIVKCLDGVLDVGAFQDSSNNGLQIENSGRIRRICCGVDASMETFEVAKRRGADLVVCHHGLSWRDSLKRITGPAYRRVSFLIRNDMALYACHLPLDAHPRYGNNAQICRALGLRRLRKFGMYEGVEIGFAGPLPAPMSYARFKRLVERVVGPAMRTMDFGKKTVRTVAVVSGGGAGELAEAAEKGIDVFLSGEGQLHAYHTAREAGMNAIFAGHYATEVFGVRALAALLARRFRVKCEFVDLRTPW